MGHFLFLGWIEMENVQIVLKRIHFSTDCHFYKINWNELEVTYLYNILRYDEKKKMFELILCWLVGWLAKRIS